MSTDGCLILLSNDTSRDARAIHATVWNTQGISLLLEGKSNITLDCFSASVKEAEYVPT